MSTVLPTYEVGKTVRKIKRGNMSEGEISLMEKPPITERESRNTEFFFKGKYSENDKQQFIEAQDEDLKKICDYLKTKLAKNIKFKTYLDIEDKKQDDPFRSVSRASARFSEMTVYRNWKPGENPHFPHEITHLVTHTWNEPYNYPVTLDTFDGKEIQQEIEMLSTSFMQEGLAIAVDDLVFNEKLTEKGETKTIEDWCRENINQLPKLTDVINFDGFNSIDNKIVVPYAAGFSKFLLQEYGLVKYQKMYVSIRETYKPKGNIKIIEKIYQKSTERLQKEFIKSLK